MLHAQARAFSYLLGDELKLRTLEHSGGALLDSFRPPGQHDAYIDSFDFEGQADDDEG